MKALTVVPGSLAQQAKDSGKSLAETFVSADAIILVDCSGSMGNDDAGPEHNEARYKVALRELAALQKAMPGKIAVIGFDDQVQFFPGGQPTWMGGGTDLAKALRFAKVADVSGMRFVLICDGYPDSAEAALQVASTYQNRIDTIFIGDPNSRDAIAFLKRLAEISGGAPVVASGVAQLAAQTQRLLLAA